MGKRFKREEISVDVWQKPTQYCKAIILQFKKIKILKALHGGNHHPLLHTSHIWVSVSCHTKHRTLSAPTHTRQISCNTQKWHIRVHTIRALTTLGWNNLPAYLCCPRTWLPLKGRESGSCSSLYLNLQHMAAPSLHLHWWDQVKSREEMLRASQKSLYHLQNSWRCHRDKKKSPLSVSNLNSCHINNLLHWDIQIPDTSSVLDTANSNCVTLSSGFHSWEFNRGCGVASRASQLTFPAPTGPTTANSSPGLTVKERPRRVGVSDSCKLKFIKMYPFQ